MRLSFTIALCALLLGPVANAAPKPHVVILGKWTTIAFRAQDTDSKPSITKVRPLYVDGRVKEFTTGPAHEVTDHIFVVQRIYRVNDSLPQETGPTQWGWQRGSWLLADHLTGKVQQIILLGFDPDSSAINWFRDYAAYCGIAEDGRKLFAIVMQLGRRKPLLKKDLGPADNSAQTCAPPVWERNPVRASFQPKSGQGFTFAIKTRAVEVTSVEVNSDDDEVDDSGND
jgi:hypothetical protein